MKKKGFSLVEVVVAFAIFLAAFIPINNLMRNTTSLLNKDPNQLIKESSGTGSETPGEYEGNILQEFMKQIERRGYDEIEVLIPGDNGVYETKYTLNKATSGDSSGCLTDQYYLTPLDNFSKDPHDETRSKCYSQDTTEGDFSGEVIFLSARKGIINNIKEIDKSNEFIYVEIYLENFPKQKRDVALTKLQEFLE